MIAVATVDKLADSVSCRWPCVPPHLVSLSSLPVRQNGRMKAPLAILALLAVSFPQPAHATGGLTCKTAGPDPIEINLGFGHVPSAGLFLAQLTDSGENVPVIATQWWARGSELRLALVSADAWREEAIVIATWNDKAKAHDGSVWRSGKRRWVRCRES